MMLTKIVEHWNVPSYNYFLEIAALVLLVVLFVKFICKKRFSTYTNRLFIVALICAILDISVDIIASVFADYIYNVPLWINFLFNGLFYIFQVMFPCFMFAYILLLLGPKFYRNKKHYIFLLPLVFFLIVIITNPFTHWIYYFSEIEGQLIYTHGPLFLAYYGCAVFYFILNGTYIIVLRKNLEKRATLTLLFALFIILIGIVIQIILPYLLLTGITITSALYLIEDNIANPNDMVDKISGVFNFNALMIYLDRDSGEHEDGYIVALEIEGVTPINDTLGMLTGNTLYKQLGLFFNGLDGEPKTFRLFSSNFVLLFKQGDDAEKAALAIRERFEETWDVNNSEINLTSKIIVFKNDGNLKSCNQFLEYLSSLFSEWRKRAVQNILYVNQNTIDNLVRENAIQNAISNALTTDYNGLSMRYQPIYNVKTGKFDRAEALIRYNDDRLGFISPAEFIPIIEKAGLAKLLDEFVLKEVCKFVKRHTWMDVVDVNVSGAEFFTNPAHKFLSIIKKSGIDPKHICFEITETSTTNYPEHVSKFMHILIDAGAKFAIDDFGTGYSNVSQLLKQPFNIIKLDKTLLNEDNKTRSFLLSINSLFKQFNYPLVIEGVETSNQLSLAKDLNIDYVQGFYFSKPLTEEEFDAFIAKQLITLK